MNPVVRNAIRKVGIDDSWKSRAAYRAYEFIFHHENWKKNQKMREFYTQLVQSVPMQEWNLECKIIFDIGANKGDTTDYFRFAADQVVSLEPDHRLANRIRERFRPIDSVTVVEAAVDKDEGYSILYLNPEFPAYNTLNGKWRDILQSTSEHQFNQSYVVETLSLDHLIQTYGKPVYIKLDIEGAELSALQGLTQSVPFLSFECNLPHFRKETLHILQVLKLLSPEVDFMYSTSEGFRKNLSRWIPADEMADFIQRTSYSFLEIMARMQHQDPLPQTPQMRQLTNPELMLS